IGSQLPIKKWWNGYANFWANYQHVKGMYNNINVDVSAPGFGAYMQNSFTLGKDYTAEVSGWLYGAGLEGTWKHKTMGAMDMGIQKTIMQSKATIKVSVTDIFNTAKFRGTSSYGGT